MLPSKGNRNTLGLSYSQNQFLECLGIFAVGKAFVKKNFVRPKANSYARFVSIDVCSPLGQVITQGKRMPLRSKKSNTKPSNAEESSTEFPITYRKYRLHNFKQDPHFYSFNKRHRQMRAQVLEQGKFIHLILY